MSSSRQWLLGLFYLLLLLPPAPASPWGHLPAQPYPAQRWEMPAGAHSGPLANFCNTIITGHRTEEAAGSITPLVFLQHLCRSFHLHTLTLFPHGGKAIFPLTLHHSLLCGKVEFHVARDFGQVIIPGRNKGVQAFAALALQQFGFTFCISITWVCSTQPMPCPDSWAHLYFLQQMASRNRVLSFLIEILLSISFSNS